MRNYTNLYITYLKKDRGAIEEILPPRFNVSGGTMGPGFEVTKSTSYGFNPPLTREEMIGLTGKLVDLGVKKIVFTDTLSLGENF